MIEALLAYPEQMRRRGYEQTIESPSVEKEERLSHSLKVIERPGILRKSD